MTEPYLILHKVRGEPAFDIAEKAMIGEEEGWIVSTSGHRAYPYRDWPLCNLANIADINAAGVHDYPTLMDEIPPDWPDHFSCNNPQPRLADRVPKLLELIGLKQKVRRI